MNQDNAAARPGPGEVLGLASGLFVLGLWLPARVLGWSRDQILSTMLAVALGAIVAGLWARIRRKPHR